MRKKREGKGEKRLKLGGWKDRQGWCKKRRRSSRMQRGGVVILILWSASSSIALNYCFILPLMRWDLFLPSSSSLWFSARSYMCLCTCVYLNVCITIQYVWSTYDQINTVQSGLKSPPFLQTLCLSSFCIFHFLHNSLSRYLFFSFFCACKTKMKIFGKRKKVQQWLRSFSFR